MEPAMYNEKRIKKSELLQLILLDNLYAQSWSENIISGLYGQQFRFSE